MNIMNDEYLQKRLERAARCLKVLAHPIRLMIIHLLGEGELSVQELEKAVGISQSSVSQHLGLLKDRNPGIGGGPTGVLPPPGRGSALRPLLGCGWNEAGAGAPPTAMKSDRPISLRT
jgi:hypothetical protein